LLSGTEVLNISQTERRLFFNMYNRAAYVLLCLRKNICIIVTILDF